MLTAFPPFASLRRAALYCSLLCAAIFMSHSAVASCMGYADAEATRFEHLAGANPAKAVDEIKLAIANLADTPTNRLRKAALHSTLAEAYSGLEMDTDARIAAQTGMKLLNDENDPLFINLVFLETGNTYDNDGIQAAIAKIGSHIELQEKDSPAHACLLVVLGLLQHQIVRDDLASASLTSAYRMSLAPERTRQRMHTAEILSYIVRSLGDYKQALALNQEGIDWYRSQGAIFDLATSRFVRGEILRYQREHKAAIVEFESSRTTSEEMNDPQGVAFANLRLCNIRTELGELSAARQLCSSALKAFDTSQSNSARNEVLIALADLDLRQNNPGGALIRLNEVLTDGGKEMLPRRVPRAFELRAQAHKALGNHREALRDFNVFVERFKAINDTEREQQAAVLRAQFQSDKQIETNTALQRELELQNERLQRQEERLRITVIAAVIFAAMVALLTYLLLVNRRQKQALSRLADIDALTNLPNRRHLFDLATRALENAKRDNATVTVAVIDLDHFKNINDRFGHAAGDYVLEQFAQRVRAELRETDLLGRWGGEEFLVLLPNTALDKASVMLERVRSVAQSIKMASAPELKVTLSAGLATNEGGTADLDEIVARADTALYQAKNSGRDVVRIAEDSYSNASTGVRRALRGSGVHMNTGNFEARKPEE
jgi:diguanylate cyclase (GGDEF)-like protein